MNKRISPSTVISECGVTLRTLQYYRSLGLIPSAKRHGRYFYYECDIIGKIRKIQKLVNKPLLKDLVGKI